MEFNFQDIFQSGFLENVDAVPFLDMIIALLLAFVLGVFVAFIYKRTYAGVMYSASFGVTLIAMTMITTVIMLAVTSNIVLSLGMVGALSIVRFRTAIKEPSDIVFLFWAIAIGIVLAAGMIPLAVFGSLIIGIVIYLFANYQVFDQPYILVVHVDTQETEKAIKEFVEDKVGKLSLKSKSVLPGAIELNYEVRLKDDETTFINQLSETSGVTNVVLVSYNGDYMS